MTALAAIGAAVCAALTVIVAAAGRADPRGGRSPATGRPLPIGWLIRHLTRPIQRFLDPFALRLAHRRQARAATRTVERDLPELIDLLVLSTAAGLTVPASLPVLIRWGPPTLAGPLVHVDDDIGRGRRTTAAVADLAERWGTPARPLIQTVLAHLRDGTPLREPLSRAAHEARLRRQRAAEARARRLPVLLLFPLVFCVLPAFGLLTVAPLVAGTLRSLQGETIEASASTPLPPEESPCSALSAVSPVAPVSPVPIGASPRPSTPSCFSAPPPSPSSSWPGPGALTPSPASSTRSWTPSSAT